MLRRASCNRDDADLSVEFARRQGWNLPTLSGNPAADGGESRQCLARRAHSVRENLMFAKSAAEFLGTFWLVLGGCGSAVLAAAFPQLGIGFVGVAFAFGLTVLTMAYAIGHVSGCHLNPAVSVGLVAGKKFPASELPAYIIAQVVGAIAGAGVLYVIASGKADFSLAGGFASNGYGEHSPGGYSLLA